MTKSFVGLGSNLGDRERTLRRAVEEIGFLPGTEVVRVSSFYRTDPVGDTEQPEYLNAVAELRTELPPPGLLWNLQRIESRLGRGKRNRSGPRPVDLDLLFYDGLVLSIPGLDLPHPRFAERSFVLVPMVELDPGWLDPRSGLRMDELLRERPGRGRVRWSRRFEA